MIHWRLLTKVIGFSIPVPGNVVVVIPQLLARWRNHPYLPLNRFQARRFGLLSIGAGVSFYAHTALEYATEGKGTPSPTHEPEDLVTSGVYAYSRNPMYIGALLIITGQGLLQRSLVLLWWAVGCWIGFHNRVLKYEDPHLLEKHGKEFDRYRATVPRWLSLLK